MDRRKGWLWIGGGIFLALLAGALVFMMMRATALPSQAPVPQAEGPRVRVVVAARDIPQHTVIKETDVSVKEVPAEAVPDEAMLSVESVLGKIAQDTISSGAILDANRLASYAPGSGEVVFTTLGDQVVLAQEDQVLLAIPPRDLMSAEFLVVGNHVDVLVSLPQEAEGAVSEGPAPEEEPPEGAQPELITAYTIQNAEVAMVKYSGDGASKGGDEKGETQPSSSAPQALLIALDPQDALILKHLIDRGAIIDLALRAPTSDQLFDTQPVDRDYLYDRYQLRR